MQTFDRLLLEPWSYDNNFHTRSTIEGFLALLPTDSIFLCIGQVVVQTEKNMSLISLNVDGFLDSLI